MAEFTPAPAPKTAGLFKIVSYESGNKSINAGSYGQFSATDLGITPPQGYSPIGFVDVGATNINCTVIRAQANQIFIRNNASSAQSTTTKLTVVYIKSEYVE